MKTERFKSGHFLRRCLHFAPRRNATFAGLNSTDQASHNLITMARLMPRRCLPILTLLRTSLMDRNQRRLLDQINH